MIEITDPGMLAKARLLRCSNPAYVAAITHGSVWAAKGIPTHIYGCLTVGSQVYAPRAWYFAQPEATSAGMSWADHAVNPPLILLDPLDHQFQAVTNTVELVNENDKKGLPTDTYIKMPPSEGKTICGMILAHCLRLRTLVVVPTQEIEEAWVSDCEKVFGIKPDQIGRIRGPKLVIGDFITVGSIQTLMNLDPAKWGDKFGLTLIDETHRISSNKFQEVIKNSRSLVRIGLTATDYRKDGTFPIVKWHLGEPAFSSDVRTNSVPLVFHRVQSPYCMPQTKKDYTFTDLIAYLLQDKGRNDMIIKLVKALVPTGNVLVVSPRVEFNEWLAKVLESVVGVKVASIKGGSKGRADLYKSIKAGEYPITVATTQIVSEGASNPRWTHLVNCTPFSDKKLVVQLTGRVIRKMDGKTEGHYWDFCDGTSGMAKVLFDKRAVPLHSVAAKTIIHQVDASNTVGGTDQLNTPGSIP